MKRIAITMASLAIFALTLAGCGGGGGASSSQPTSAVLKISTSGTIPTGSSLSGIGVTVDVPAGVTVDTDASGIVKAGVVTPSGVASSAGVASTSFVAATGGTPAKLKFVLVSSSVGGFGVGEFATVTFKVTSGTPAPTDFTVPAPEFQPADLDLKPLSGLSASYTVELK